jgi:hypothetical protein
MGGQQVSPLTLSTGAPAFQTRFRAAGSEKYLIAQQDAAIPFNSLGQPLFPSNPLKYLSAPDSRPQIWTGCFF